eukprot:206055_1
MAPCWSGNGGKKSRRRAREATNTAKAEKRIDSRSQTTVTSNDVRIPEGRPVRQVKRVRKRTPAIAPTACRLLDVDARRDVKTIDRLVSAAGCTRSFSSAAEELRLWNEGPDSVNGIALTLPGPKLYGKVSHLAMWEQSEEKVEQEMNIVKKKFDLGFQLAEDLDDAEEIAMISHTEARSQLLNRWHVVQAAALIAEEVVGKALKELEEELSRDQGQVPPELKKGKIERQIYWAAKTLAAQRDELMALCKHKQVILKVLQAREVEVDVNSNTIHAEERCGTGTIKGCKTTCTIVEGHNKEQEVNISSSRKREEGVSYNEESTDSLYKSLSQMLPAGSAVSERLDPSCGFLTDEDLCDYWKLLNNDSELEKGICFTLVQRMCPNVNALLRNLLCDKTAAICGVHEGGMDFSEKDEVTYDIKQALEVLGVQPSHLKSTKLFSVKKLAECTDTSIDMLKSDAMADKNNFPRLMVQCEKLYNELSAEISEQRREKQWLSTTLQDIFSRRERLLQLRISIAEEKGLDMGRT